MVGMMMIRPETISDYDAIADVTARAFADVQYSDQTEAEIIKRLRNAGALTISLVAIKNDALIGHVAFSPVTIDGEHDKWFGLGPVSVEPKHQALGIGSTLIWAGLEQLRFRCAAGCVVLGNPAYYRRFGFERSEGLRYKGGPAEYFMCLNLAADQTPSGFIDYAPAFSG